MYVSVWVCMGLCMSLYIYWTVAQKNNACHAQNFKLQKIQKMIQWKFRFSAPLVPQREQELQSLLCLSRDAIPRHHCQALLFPSKASGFISVSCVWTERVALTCTHHHVWNRELAGSCSVAQGARLGAGWWPRAVGRGAARLTRGGIRVYTELVRTARRQKLTRYCEAGVFW